jgi:hypothetical protein
MCYYLHESGFPFQDLGSELLEYVLMYHQGHGSCNAWALTILLEMGQWKLLEEGMQKLSIFLKDYTLKPHGRTEIFTALAFLKYMRAKREGNLQALEEAQKEIRSIPHFESLLDIDLRKKMK